MKSKTYISSQSEAQFIVTSPGIIQGILSDNQVFNGFGYSGKNESPEIIWSGIPEGTKSFAITAYDPDAPTGSGWWHWIVYNIPVDITSLSEGAGVDGGKLLPKGAVMGRNDFGLKAYGGACPPPGRQHRYIFTVHALRADKIEVSEDASAAMIGFHLTSNCIDKAVLVATFGS